MKVVVKREPLTYEPEAPRSFFRDLALLALHDENAETRLVRHQHEMDVELGQETRAASGTLGFGGEFDPPLWLIDRFKTSAKAGRPFADLLNPLPLPPNVDSINVPKFSDTSITGVDTGVQGGQGSPASSVDPTTSDISSNVITISGFFDVSQQLLDMTPDPGIDGAAWVQLNQDYNVRLEGQLLTGTGSASGQFLGLSNFTLPAGNSISGAGVAVASPTMVTNLWPLLGQAFAAIGNNRGLAPEFWLMAPRRWAAIGSSLDSSSRPIMSPGSAAFHANQDTATGGSPAPFGPILGLAVYTDGAIPAGTTADNIYCVRASDMLLFESPTPKILAAVNPLASTLQVRLRLYKYAAFVGNTYTSGVAVVSGIPRPTSY